MLLACIVLSTELAIAKEKYHCDEGRKYCKEMSSCEEAKFYLNRCGMTRLDRDRDGIPCENVCGRKGK
ncbi:excalibur calcium-binding domain-containing protein [Pelistega europaea]|nr:excalibur calcium-binding domain-containing protein [Pelistega europaea]